MSKNESESQIRRLGTQIIQLVALIVAIQCSPYAMAERLTLAEQVNQSQDIFVGDVEKVSSTSRDRQEYCDVSFSKVKVIKQGVLKTKDRHLELVFVCRGVESVDFFPGMRTLVFLKSLIAFDKGKKLALAQVLWDGESRYGIEKEIPIENISNCEKEFSLKAGSIVSLDEIIRRIKHLSINTKSNNPKGKYLES